MPEGHQLQQPSNDLIAEPVISYELPAEVTAPPSILMKRRYLGVSHLPVLQATCVARRAVTFAGNVVNAVPSRYGGPDA